LEDLNLEYTFAAKQKKEQPRLRIWKIHPAQIYPDVLQDIENQYVSTHMPSRERRRLCGSAFRSNRQQQNPLTLKDNK